MPGPSKQWDQVYAIYIYIGGGGGGGGGVPSYIFYFSGSANLGYSLHWTYTPNIRKKLFIYILHLSV